jgi:hypothetical protein
LVRNPSNEVASDALWKKEIVPYTAEEFAEICADLDD